MERKMIRSLNFLDRNGQEKKRGRDGDNKRHRISHYCDNLNRRLAIILQGIMTMVTRICLANE